MGLNTFLFIYFSLFTPIFFQGRSLDAEKDQGWEERIAVLSRNVLVTVLMEDQQDKIGPKILLFSQASREKSKFLERLGKTDLKGRT